MIKPKTQARSKLMGILFLALGMVLFGSATPISKIVGESFPVFTASLMRVVLGSLSLLPFVVKDFGENFSRLNRKTWLEIGLIALFGMFGFTVFLVYGMRLISGVAGSIIMSTTPALTAFGAFLFLKSPMDWRRILAISFGVAGLILINLFKSQFNGADSENFYLGVLLVVLAISCEAVYTLIGKKTTETVNPLFASFMACTVSIPPFMALALILDLQDFQLGQVRPESWYYLLWWGVGALGAGSALWYSGLARADGTTAAGFMSIMPLSALILSYTLLGESFELIHIPGIVLVLGSVGLMSWVHMSYDQQDIG